MNPCVCISLRKGAYIIGVLEIVLYGFSAGLYGFAIAGLAYSHDGGSYLNDTEILAMLKDAQIGEDEIRALQAQAEGIIVILSLVVALSAVQLAVGIVLVLGVQKTSYNLLRTWMGVKTLVIMLSALLLIVSLTRKVSDTRSVIIDCVSCIIGIYCLVVVGAYSNQLKKRDRSPASDLGDNFNKF